VWHLKRAIGKCIVSWIDAKTYNEVHASRRLTFFYDGNHSCIVAVAVAVTAALRFFCFRIIRNLCSCSSETASTCVVGVLFWKMCPAALAGHTFWEVPNPTSCATAAAAASRLIHTFYFFGQHLNRQCLHFGKLRCSDLLMPLSIPGIEIFNYFACAILSWTCIIEQTVSHP